MDQTDAGGDSTEQFHRNEAISAVVDEGFLGEDDDDYEDLYNDVNVGEGFLQSVKKNEQVEEPVEPVIHPVVDDRKFESKNEVFSEPRVELGVKHEMVGSKDDVFGEPRVEIGQSVVKLGETESRNEVNNNSSMPNLGMGQQQTHMGSLGNAGSGNVNGSDGNVYGNGGGGGGGMNVGGGVGGGGGGVNMGGGGGGTILFVGDLNWWTTDAELESELCKYGNVKEVKFFDEKASGKSKGYCQVEFYDPSAAVACKEGMNGHVFNGRPCVVAFASPFSVKRMGEAQVNRNQQMAQSNAAQAKRGPGDVPGKTGGNNMPAGGNFQGGGDNNNRGSSRGHGKSRLAQEDEHRSRSRDADYGKKRRVTAE
ncbi:putative RNA recognition motif domain, nucleotide-binding alpha-beta plait domain superfamily [Helianthus annuus]|nr:putative RNA recognition motif domain, nucleotide-binding alpha-beta plait domain superfamily [Helianthus annuus]